MFENKIELDKEELIVLLNYLNMDIYNTLGVYLDPTRQMKEYSSGLKKAVYWIEPKKDGITFKIRLYIRSVHTEYTSNRKPYTGAEETNKYNFEKTIPFKK